MHSCGESGATDAKVQEELGMLQMDETIPEAIIDYITKAIKAGHEEDWSTLEADSFSVWVVSTLKRCAQGAMSNNAGKFDVLRNVTWPAKQIDFQFGFSHRTFLLN